MPLHDALLRNDGEVRDPVRFGLDVLLCFDRHPIPPWDTEKGGLGMCESLASSVSIHKPRLGGGSDVTIKKACLPLFGFHHVVPSSSVPLVMATMLGTAAVVR